MRDVQSTTLYQWFDKVWNQGNENAIDELMHEDGEARGIAGADHLKGPAGFKTFFHDFRNQFRDIRIDIEDVVCEGDMETARTNVTAIHNETGKQVTFSGMCMAKISNGKIAEAWNNYDFLQMYQQLGQKLTMAD